MEIYFLHDDVTGEPHIARHGVEPSEVKEVLRKPDVEYDGREKTRIAMDRRGLAATSA